MEILIFVIGAAAGAGGLFYYFRNQDLTRQQLLQQQEDRSNLLLRAAQEKLESATKDAELSAKAELLRNREQLEQELHDRRQELNEQKRRNDKKEEQLDRKEEQLEQRERGLEQRRVKLEQQLQVLEETEKRYRELTGQVEKRLGEIAQLTPEEAKAQLIGVIEGEARRESARIVKQVEDETRESSKKRVQEIVAGAIQRYAGEIVSEHTVSVVSLPSDDMKGRIIGREGRNIRALEAATGCDLIIDDTPEAVVISGFNPARREVAKRTLEELVGDGRIHPARIEEVVKKAKKGVNNEIREAGEQAVFELGMHNMHPELVRLLGSLKFRTSYTQNVLAHSKEVAYFAGIMADELGLDSMIARRCGLLHDIGKAVDHEVQGAHAVIGGQLAKKYREHPLVVNAIAAHHFDVEAESIYVPLTNAADALSAARPGARRETMEVYIKRLEELEKIANEFNGVEKSYAIQAGRELRVMVAFNKVNDEGAMLLARNIAQRIEAELSYPGQIRVTVIREMRATEVAQ